MGEPAMEMLELRWGQALDRGLANPAIVDLQLGLSITTNADQIMSPQFHDRRLGIDTELGDLDRHLERHWIVGHRDNMNQAAGAIRQLLDLAPNQILQRELSRLRQPPPARQTREVDQKSGISTGPVGDGQTVSKPIAQELLEKLAGLRNREPIDFQLVDFRLARIFGRQSLQYARAGDARTTRITDYESNPRRLGRIEEMR
ncbi:MAG: hypothetical protein AAF560_11410 [Acidobacteriota bacterium]